jgi:hypothetical protein
MTTYMAECFWPGVSEQLVADAGDRARREALGIRSQDGLARYIGSILVPSDEIAFCFLEAASLETAGDIGRRAAIPFERILEIVRVRSTPREKELR